MVRLYALLLRVFVPRMRDRSREMSEARSRADRPVVDSYTNIQTVKLFARARDEDAFVREAVDWHTEAFRRQHAASSPFAAPPGQPERRHDGRHRARPPSGCGRSGEIAVGAVATALPMAWQIANISGWVAFNVTAIFENIGVVQEAHGLHRRAAPPLPGPAPTPCRSAWPRGEIRFENLRFGYGRRDAACCSGSTSRIAPGERVGLVGHSGAGKSTLVNLLLRFFAPKTGRILIDGQDIAGVTQESLRAADRRGDAGHLAAAPLDPRQHPLRPAGSDRGRDRGRGRARRMPTTSSRELRRLARPRAATTPMSASAA